MFCGIIVVATGEREEKELGCGIHPKF